MDFENKMVTRQDTKSLVYQITNCFLQNIFSNKKHQIYFKSQSPTVTFFIQIYLLFVNSSFLIFYKQLIIFTFYYKYQIIKPLLKEHDPIQHLWVKLIYSLQFLKFYSISYLRNLYFALFQFQLQQYSNFICIYQNLIY